MKKINGSEVEKAADEAVGIAFIITILKWIVGMGLVLIVFGALFFWSHASGQTLTPVVQPVEQSACLLVSRYAYRGEEKALMKLKCEAEKAAVRQQIREANAPAKPIGSDPIGVASKNVAKTTVTYRDNTGKALEGSAGWSSIEKAKIKAEVSIAKAEANANRPIVVNEGYGYGGGYYGGYGYAPIRGGAVVTSCGGAGCNTVYGSGR